MSKSAFSNGVYLLLSFYSTSQSNCSTSRRVGLKPYSVRDECGAVSDAISKVPATSTEFEDDAQTNPGGQFITMVWILRE